METRGAGWGQVRRSHSSWECGLFRQMQRVRWTPPREGLEWVRKGNGSCEGTSMRQDTFRRLERGGVAGRIGTGAEKQSCPKPPLKALNCIEMLWEGSHRGF